ncbi:MAG: hypothetical protein ACT4QE_01860, partial [Anaerolineales bacterium]
MKKKDWKLIEIERDRLEHIPVPIVSEAAVATTIMADGRLVPLVIVDCSARHDIGFAIRAHKHA